MMIGSSHFLPWIKMGKTFLKPVMGAFAHLVAFEPNTAGFAHLHPLEYEPPKSKEDSRIGPLSLVLNPQHLKLSLMGSNQGWSG